MFTMNENTLATAVARTDRNGLQIGNTYAVISATPGENSRYGATIVVRGTFAEPYEDLVDGETVTRFRDVIEDVSMSWFEYRTSFIGTRFAHDGWVGKDEFLMLDDDNEPLN